MKKIFLMFLPLMAAVVLATSCSKDDDTSAIVNNEPDNATPAPAEEVAKPGYVQIPFSVKVNEGTSLSKISYSGDGISSITSSFEDSDAGLTMTVTGTGINQSTLTLSKDESDFYFIGTISVEEGKETHFATGNITLIGTCGTALTEATSSTVSLADLMKSCNHQYKAEFLSNATSITLYDQNAYLHFTLPSIHTRLQLKIGETTSTFTELSDNKEIWIAVPGGTTVWADLLGRSVATAASNIYNANRSTVAEYVDLGLPSGLLWATRNLGATKPWNYGDYYAWGEITTKNNYDWETYQHCNGSSNTLTKYCDHPEYGYNDFIDDLTVLQRSDDAATAVWGYDWRMPTKAEYQELMNKCTWTWTDSYNGTGVAGYIVTGNSNSIFLPAAGCRGGSRLIGDGFIGYYWSSSLYDREFVYSLKFASGYRDVLGNYRCDGYSVRAVKSN